MGLASYSGLLSFNKIKNIVSLSGRFAPFVMKPSPASFTSLLYFVQQHRKSRRKAPHTPLIDTIFFILSYPTASVK